MTFADQGDDPAVKKEGRSCKEAGGQKLQTLKSFFISEAILSLRGAVKKPYKTLDPPLFQTRTKVKSASFEI